MQISVWNPHRLGLIKDLEKVQMRATKLVISIKNFTYKDRLNRLKLPTLKYRRIRGDMIEVYKILTNKYDSGVNVYLEKQQDNIGLTRGHSLKLVNNRYHQAYDLRKFSFAPRIVNIWNSLPEIVISTATTDTFKRRLDKFWQHQDILYDYKVELTGDGNRSQINTDDNIVL